MRVLAFSALAVLAAGIAAPSAFGQGQGGGAPVYQNWFPVGAPATLSVTTANARTALPGTGTTARVCNTGTVDAYVVLGTGNTVVATTASGSLLASGHCQSFNLIPFSTRYTYVAAVTASASTALRIEAGLGSPIASDSLSTSGGGGGSGTVTAVSAADATVTVTPNPIVGAGAIGLNLANPNTWTGAQTFGGGKLIASNIINTGTLTLPTDTDTLIGRDTVDTLTNKTISGASNTLANIGNSSLTNSGLTIAGHFVSLGGTQTLSASDLTNGTSGTGAICLVTGSACGGGGGAVSVTASGPTIVINPTPGTGTFTVGTQALINPQTGTTYTVLSTDMGKTVTHSNASATAVTLPQAGTTGFEVGKSFAVQNLGAGTVTYTPGGGSTINGAASLAFRQNMGCVINSDGSNYQIEECTAALPLASTSAFGLMKPDGSTITCTSGVCAASAPAAGGSTTQLNYNLAGALTGVTSNYTGSAISLLTNTAPLANSLSLPSTATGGLSIFNTSDQATNTEYGSFAWSSNFFIIQTVKTGTGTTRQLTLNSANTNGIIQQVAGSTKFTLSSTFATFSVPILSGANYIRTTPTIVGSLTAAATAGAGARWAVTDASVCTNHSTVVAGGSTFCPVISDGSTWLAQ